MQPDVAVAAAVCRCTYEIECARSLWLALYLAYGLIVLVSFDNCELQERSYLHSRKTSVHFFAKVLCSSERFVHVRHKLWSPFKPRSTWKRNKKSSNNNKTSITTVLRVKTTAHILQSIWNCNCCDSLGRDCKWYFIETLIEINDEKLNLHSQMENRMNNETEP